MWCGEEAHRAILASRLFSHLCHALTYSTMPEKIHLKRFYLPVQKQCRDSNHANDGVGADNRVRVLNRALEFFVVAICVTIQLAETSREGVLRSPFFGVALA